MLLIYTIVFFISIVLYLFKLNIIASGIMIALAIFLYATEYRKENRIINVRGLFALGFIGGFGLSLLKLSNLSADYSLMTIVVVYLSYFSVYLGSFYARGKIKVEEKEEEVKVSYKKLEKIIIFLFVITFISFMIEALMLRFIPLFTISTPHAYSTFHVFMIHYITSLYIFIPSFAICNFYQEKSRRAKLFVILSYIYVVLMATLMLSRGQLFTSIIISIFAVLIYSDKKELELLKDLKLKVLVILLLIVLLALYVFITIHRAHDASYLMGIFDMKDKNMPIFVAQPYMYVAHNFENLNYMINNLADFGFGRMTLMPLYTLSMVKQIFPFTIGAPLLVIKAELSTKTLIYDFYYDFGVVGVILACFTIGYIGKVLEDFVYAIVNNKIYKRYNYLVVVFSLFSYYMLFSFMQSYFSLTDTWFNIIVLLVITFVSAHISVVKSDNK